jgi:hypothetical protein
MDVNQLEVYREPKGSFVDARVSAGMTSAPRGCKLIAKPDQQNRLMQRLRAEAWI